MDCRSHPCRTIRSLDFRHCDEKPHTASPLASTLTKRDAHNSFIIRLYENSRVSLEFTAKFSEESGFVLSIFSVLKVSEKCALPKPFQFIALRTVSFSVACKSIACHSYENCRVCTNNFHSGTQFLKNYFNSGRISGGMNHLQGAGFTSHLLRLTPSSSADSINSHPAERHFHFAVIPSGAGIP